MTAHALIIAIEQYDQAVGMAKKLPNTLEAGKAFREWLRLVIQGRKERFFRR